ncbi:hypothetical protein N8T08_006110 [Aspergillus melleus]|uniref:Uncharacterized protein n=1 Tax=Aspergillus melleus TaxID=138277 RepID=A0ACC3B097_9EURO|nr:hypothetical protein N8T08_006110 [Aspergillus melleus]
MVLYDLTISELDQMAADLVEMINLVKASAEDSKEHWESRSGQDLKLPSDFQTLLDDTLIAFGPETMSAALISARINTILLSTVGAAKQALERVEDASKLPYQMARYSRVHLCLEQVITMQRPNDLDYNDVRCIADGILWYGHETELEAMLVVERTTSVIENDTVRTPPIMLLFYHSRKLAGRKSDMYGIVTNSYKWHFTRVTSGGQIGRTHKSGN